MRVRCATVCEVRREVAQVGGRLCAEEIFQAGEKSPRFGFAAGAVANVNVRPKQAPDLPWFRRLPFVVQSGDRPVRFHACVKTCLPFDAVLVARGLNKRDRIISLRRFRQPRFAGMDFPDSLAGFCIGDNPKQRMPHGHLSPTAVLAGKDFRVSEAIRLANELHAQQIVADGHIVIRRVDGQHPEFGIQAVGRFCLHQLRLQGDWSGFHRRSPGPLTPPAFTRPKRGQGAGRQQFLSNLQPHQPFFGCEFSTPFVDDFDPQGNSVARRNDRTSRRNPNQPGFRRISSQPEVRDGSSLPGFPLQIDCVRPGKTEILHQPFARSG